MHCSQWLSPCIDPPFAQVKVNGSLISDGKVQVLNGTMSTFECFALGSPPVEASWSTSVERINRDQLGSKHNTMTLQLAQEDEGIYTCIANNTLERLSHLYHVDVQVYGEYPAHIHALKHDPLCYLCNEWNVHAYIYIYCMLPWQRRKDERVEP